MLEPDFSSGAPAKGEELRSSALCLEGRFLHYYNMPHGKSQGGFRSPNMSLLYSESDKALISIHLFQKKGSRGTKERVGIIH